MTTNENVNDNSDKEAAANVVMPLLSLHWDASETWNPTATLTEYPSSQSNYKSNEKMESKNGRDGDQVGVILCRQLGWTGTVPRTPKHTSGATAPEVQPSLTQW